MSWSTGKDSAFALSLARADDSLEVVALLTTVNANANRVAMHAVRRRLLEAQAEALELPLYVVELPWPCPNAKYEELMASAIAEAEELGIERVVFGDIFLADIRAYREEMLERTRLRAVFPLWGRQTGALASEMIASGIRAVVTCVDPAQAPPEIAGRFFDADLLVGLPDGVDPCGENGEFHTFVFDAPGFARPLDVAVGDVVERDGFVFADLVPE
jgi:uncharacterized protein (TIGR00290 family)